jgi:hypothetical protein
MSSQGAPTGPTWIQTLSSGHLDLANPDPAHISLRHIAIVLARTPRFGGHTERGVYSVAQHCVEGARAMLRDGHGRDAAAAFLLHDAHEAYIGDIPTPVVAALVKYAGPIARNALVCIKYNLDAAIYAKAGLPYPSPHRSLIHLYDLRMLRTERDARLAKPPAPWADAVEAAEPVEGCDLFFWGEDVARAAYLEMLREFDILC